MGFPAALRVRRDFDVWLRNRLRRTAATGLTRETLEQFPDPY